MEKIILKINHFIFSWYYKICGDHFRQWTFIKSVKILVQNYDHQMLMFNHSEDHKIALIKENDKLRKELFDIKIKQCANPAQVDLLNKMFGVDIKSDSAN